MTRDVVEASRVRPGERVGGSPANTQGHTLIRPGGRGAYPAMWVRDFSMSLDSEFITLDEAAEHLKFIAKSQNGRAQRKLKSGAIIPPYAIPDHINFDGGAVFYPGTYSAGEDQGGEPYGVLPPADDHYEYIHIAHHLAVAGRQAEIDFKSLTHAFDAVDVDAATGGMVSTTAEQRAVGFGFCDAIFLTGSLLFPSLLRWRACREMMRMLPEDGERYNRIAEDIATHLAPVFADPKGSGWLLAATGVGRQPDVWGTLFALYLQVLSPKDATNARNVVIEAVKAGTITLDGAVRHVPTTADASPTSAWEKTAGVALNTYQNGAYWHTPTGWLLNALYRHDPVLARKQFSEYIAHLRSQDFRKGEQFGAPWECFGRDGAARQNPIYMASVALPLSVIRKIEGT
ncbi:MAG: hypothetical protein QOF78_793 [Phycisphaerales bacterium]|nr:hypothetical protein [Phycisphaerales bacterium]